MAFTPPFALSLGVALQSACRSGKMNPTREPEPEPESFIRVWVKGYSGRVVIGSTRLTRLLFRVGYGSRVIGFGSGRVGSTRYPHSKMNVTRQPEPEPDSFIRV